MANRIMQILFQIKGQIDGSAGNSLSALNKKTVEFSKNIRNLKTNLRKIDYSGPPAEYNANLAKAIELNRQMNEIIRKRAKIQGKRDRAEAFANAKQNFITQGGEAAGLVGGIMTITAPLRSAISGAMDFQQQMSRVAAISGAQSEGLAQLTQKAEEMGAKLPFTTVEAGKAFEYMAMAGWKTEQMMAGIEPVMKLAMASGEDLAQVSDIVTDAMTAFGLQAEDAARFSDVLARTASNANTTVGFMGNTFQYVAPVAGALKYSVEDVSLAIGMMANMSIKGEKAGTALRSTFSQIENITEELGIEVTNADGSMRPFREVLLETREAFKGLTDSEKKNKAENIVGREAMSGFLALMKTSDKDMAKLAGSIDNAAGATDKMAEKMMDNAAGAWTKYTSALDVAGNSLGKIFLPLVKKVFEYMAEGTGKVAEFVANHQDLIESLGIAAAALSNFLAVWKVLNVLIATFSLVMAASPITWLIISIAALVGAGWYLYKNWNKIVAWISNEWEYLKNTVAAVWGEICAVLSNEWEYIKAVVTDGVNSAWETISTFCENIQNSFSGVFDWLSGKWEWLSNILSQPISTTVSAVFNSSKPESNAAGGIYGRGAFLTTFAEESGESAIPHTPTARNIGLLARTNEIMGSPLGGNSYSIPISITVNGPADTATAQNIGSQVEAAVRRALDNIANQKARVSYA